MRPKAVIHLCKRVTLGGSLSSLYMCAETACVQRYLRGMDDRNVRKAISYFSVINAKNCKETVLRHMPEWCVYVVSLHYERVSISLTFVKLFSWSRFCLFAFGKSLF